MLQSLRADLYQSYQIEIDDFAICNLIKNSNESKYFLVESKKNKKKYIAKVYLINEDAYNENLQQISNEIFAMIQINHPAIIKLYGYSSIDFDHKNNPVLLTKNIGTYSLNDFFNDPRSSRIQQKLTPTHRLIIIYGIVSSMSILHTNNIIIRDFHPTNILLDDNFKPYLYDFCSPSKETDLNSLIYTAPEVHQTGLNTRASNVYSFSIMLFRLLSGSDPFTELNFKSRYQLIKKVVSGVRPVYKAEYGIPLSYQQLMQRCWSADPLKRPTFEEILSELTTLNDPLTLDDKIQVKDAIQAPTFRPDYIMGDIDMKSLQEYIESFENKYQLIEQNNDISPLLSNLHKLSDEYAKNIHQINRLNSNISNYKSRIAQLNEMMKEQARSYHLANDLMSFPNLVEPPSVIVEKLAKIQCNTLESFRSEYENFIKRNNLMMIQRLNLKTSELPNIHQKSPDEIESDFKAFFKENDEFIEKLQKKIKSFVKIAKLLPETDFKHHQLDPEYLQVMQAIEKGDLNRMKDLIERANNGCIDSLNALGIIYRTGKFGVEIDPNKYIEYFKKAAKLGHVKSINSVGVYYETVKKKNPDKPFLLYLVSSRKGCPEAFINLGRCFLYGSGIEKDEKKARTIFSKFIERADTSKINSRIYYEAKYWVGLIYYNGLGIEKNINAAIECLSPLIEQKHKEACFLMGKCYLEKNDNKKAIKFFEKGDQLGNPHCTYRLGLCYQRIGKKEEGFKCIEKAADLGLHNALIDLARCYEEGIGVKKDPKKAFEKYFEAQEVHHISAACFYLDNCYRYGIGVEKDLKKADEYRAMFERGEQKVERPNELDDIALNHIFG